MTRPISRCSRAALRVNSYFVYAMDYVIRPLTASDEPLLWDMLYQALQTAQGAPSRDILQQPEYARYVEGWGRAGDTGFVVSDKGSA